MAWQVPFGRNLMRNPKPASLTHLSVLNAPAPLLVYDRSYSGPTSVRVNFDGTAGAYLLWLSGPYTSLDEPAGSSYTARVRLHSPAGGTVDEVWLSVIYEDATYDYVMVGPVTLDADRVWTTVDIGTVTTNPAKVISALEIAIGQNSAKTVYVAGADARRGEEIDGFIVGGGNANMTWEGTPDDSPSLRGEYVVNAELVRGGTSKYSATYYLVDRFNVVQDDISEFVARCSLTQDLLAEGVKGTMQLELTERGVVEEWTDQWIRPHLTIEHADGTIEGGAGLEGALGIYSVEPPSMRYDVTSNTFTYNGYDPLWLLQQQALVAGPGDREVGAVLLAGQDYRSKVITLFGEVGFTEANGLLYLPPVPAGLSAVASRNYGAELGRPYLEFISFVLDGQAWRRPWFTLQGQATSEPRTDISQRTPDYTFATGDGSDVRWPFEVEPELDNVANRVIVFSKRSGAIDAIKVVMSISDPAHPLHPDNLGRDGQPRYIDAPRIDISNIPGLAWANLIAQDELARRSMLPYVVRMRTRAMVANLNSVYELAVSDYDGEPIEHGHGKYWCTGWQLDLADPWEMTHFLRRTIPITPPLWEFPAPPDAGPPAETPAERRKRLRKERQERERKRARERARNRRRNRAGR
jgi:hypothetical protein